MTMVMLITEMIVPKRVSNVESSIIAQYNDKHDANNTHTEHNRRAGHCHITTTMSIMKLMRIMRIRVCMILLITKVTDKVDNDNANDNHDNNDKSDRNADGDNNGSAGNPEMRLLI